MIEHDRSARPPGETPGRKARPKTPLHPLASLQRSAGNAAVSALVERQALQRDTDKKDAPQDPVKELADRTVATNVEYAKWLLDADAQGFVDWSFGPTQAQVRTLADGKTVELGAVVLDPAGADPLVGLQVAYDAVKGAIARWRDKPEGKKQRIGLGSFLRNAKIVGTGKSARVGDAHATGQMIDINDYDFSGSSGPADVLQLLRDLRPGAYGLGLPFQGEFFPPEDELAAKEKANEDAAAAEKPAGEPKPVTGGVHFDTTYEYSATWDATKKAWKEDGANSGAAEGHLKSDAFRKGLGELRKKGYGFYVFPDRRNHVHVQKGNVTGAVPQPDLTAKPPPAPVPVPAKEGAVQKAPEVARAPLGVQRDASSGHVLGPGDEPDVPDASEIAGLKQELDQVKARIAAAKRERRPPEEADVKRQPEIERKLKLRKISDDVETLRINNVAGTPADWFAKVKPVTFLGKTVTVHELLAARLKLAEDALKSETPPDGGWVSEEHSGLRPAGEGLHAFGLAIDLNPGHNPWVINPGATGAADYELPALSKEIRQITERAVMLVLARSATDEDFSSRPPAAGKDAQVEASYDKLSAASDAMKQYFELDKPEKRTELERLVGKLTTVDPDKRSADDWAKAIVNDRKAIKADAKAKQWSDPQQGFMNLDKRLVKAMTSSTGANLTWLGDDTIAAGRDIMHFDMRDLGPIKKVWSSARGSAVYLTHG